MQDELQQAQEIYDLIVTYLVTYGFQVLGAIIILLIGMFVAGKVAGFLHGFMLSKNLDVTLSKFTAATLKVVIVIFVAIIALGQIGISITPFVAAIGALSLGAGLALQGLLSNYGAGISIIVTRPFIVGDTIAVKGVSGIVQEIKLGYTRMTNEDDVMITIPNRHIVGEIIHNSKASSMLELSVGISYDSDPSRAVTIIANCLQGIQGIYEEKKALIGINSFGDSSIDIGIRCWVLTDSLFETRYRINMAIHRALADNNIVIPFPQRDVHMIQEIPA